MGMIPVPSRHVYWAELLLISIISPNASFLGHLSGILAGLLCMAPLHCRPRGPPLESLLTAPQTRRVPFAASSHIWRGSWPLQRLLNVMGAPMSARSTLESER